MRFLKGFSGVAKAAPFEPEFGAQAERYEIELRWI